MHPLILLNYA